MADTRPFEEKDVTLSNGLKVHYYDWPGSGPILIFLHPSSGYGRMWEWTADHLGDRFHVIAPDQRGHGDTDRPDGEYSAEEYAEDLRLLMQALGIDKAVLAGQSLGGRVAQVFAATHPEQTQGVILVGGPHYSNFYPTREVVTGVLRSSQNMLASQTEFPNRDAARAYVKSIRPQDADAVIDHRIDHNTKPTASGVAMKYDNVRVALGLAHMADDMRKYAVRTSCQVAILLGTRSPEWTPATAREVAKCWKRASVVEIEGASALQMENPAALAEAVRDFIDWAVKA